ncbi:hypothetical protein VTK73DRAFT_439 [Phialemonium thermophilum]|uniref:NADP-dependent oxidoreductase domain-containing protein n=1 Tax=Phialemonium thermophilum TaxID=223376 RepID=A0ABR3XEG1_9PEZI
MTFTKQRTQPFRTANRPALSTVLPPLILGTATFNTQYVSDPLSMPYEGIVRRAIELGVRAFDTSPYYGPSEDLLGRALAAATAPGSPQRLPRSDYFLITKAGRVGPAEFDYSPTHLRYSILRSLRRLHTPYLDLVYVHDVEFLPDDDSVIEAVRTLRHLRDEDHLIRYVGISGFPPERLCALADAVLRATGEPLDAVLSYGHFTVQNRTLGLDELNALRSYRNGNDATYTNRNADRSVLARLKASGVDVVLNASMLGMGLLTTAGIPPDPSEPAAPTPLNAKGAPLARWHPSPPALRLACRDLAALATASGGERLELVAIHWSLSEWSRVAASAGLGVRVDAATTNNATATAGASVMGVTSVAELEETVVEWRAALRRLLRSSAPQAAATNGDVGDDERHDRIIRLVEERMWPALGREWLDYSWDSPGEGFVNQRPPSRWGVVPDDDGIMETYANAKKKARLALEALSSPNERRAGTMVTV